MNNHPPTFYPGVNALLDELVPAVQAVLGHHFVGMYLDGSLATGDFDQDSDIDFVVVMDEEISGALFWSLQAMHDRIATTDSPYAANLEGSYLSQRAIRRYDPIRVPSPNIERGSGERLKMVSPDEEWVVHRSVLRKQGITLAGPPPRTLIDPVSPDDLRQAMVATLHGWATEILNAPALINDWGYQTYTVLSLCRILYTLEHGTVVSKPAAARWAQETLGERWMPLLGRVWEGRRHPGLKAPSDDVNGTVGLIRYALDHSRKMTRHQKMTRHDRRP
jgi:hypothetical protein